MNKRVVFASVIIALAAVAACGLYFWHVHHSDQNYHSYIPSSIDTSSWNTLTNDALGIRIKVPPQIVAYADIDHPQGCLMPLIFGTSSQATAYLMPEYDSCGTKASSNADTLSFQDGLSKEVTVIPVDNISEIAGIVKERITKNYLLSAPFYGPGGDGTQCELDSLKLEGGEDMPTSDAGTVLVALYTSGDCSISPYALTIRYSPHFRKAIFFESTFGYGEAGDYYLHPQTSSTTSGASVDQTIYASTEILN